MAEIIAGHHDDDVIEGFYVPLIVSLIGGALQLTKRGVNDLVDDLTAILPARAECLRQEGQAFDHALDEVIAALE